MKYVSLFSGIEAASVAFKPLGWEPLAFAEIEPFPSAVLAHHYPDVPNVGDMTAHDWSQYRGKCDLVVGGPPCQAFSVAGLRKSLDDDRGNLSLAYVKALHAIDPAWSITENVPGWLSTKDNAFGCFLAALVGADAPLDPPAGCGWTDAGMVSGPARSAAWRVLDAQFFGLAQRRRRVFVCSVRGAGDWRVAEALFPVAACLRGDPAPRRAQGQGVAGGAANRPGECLPLLEVGKRCGDKADPRDGLGVGQPGDPMFTLQSNAQHGLAVPDVAGTLGAKKDGGWRGDLDSSGAYVPVGIPTHEVAPCLQERGQKGPDSDCTMALVMAAIPFDTTQITHPENRSKCEPGAPSPSLAQAGHPPAIAFHVTQDPISSSGATPALGCGNSEGCGTLGVAIGFDPGQSELPKATIQAVTEGTGPLIRARVHAAATPSMAVRRLTPRECERLQGFPDFYTAIPGAKDGPRYRVLGNSMAVPVMRWIGTRIQMVEDALAAADEGRAA